MHTSPFLSGTCAILGQKCPWFYYCWRTEILKKGLCLFSCCIPLFSPPLFSSTNYWTTKPSFSDSIMRMVRGASLVPHRAKLVPHSLKRLNCLISFCHQRLVYQCLRLFWILSTDWDPSAWHFASPWKLSQRFPTYTAHTKSKRLW